MGSIWKENWKRGAKKSIVPANDDHDLLRTEDQVNLTTNASGIGGVDVVGSPTINQILKYDGTNWIPKSDAIGSGIIYDTFVVLLPTHVASDQNVLLCNASGNSIIVELPAASSSLNLNYFIKKIDSSTNTVTASGVGGDTIDGANTQVILFQYDALRIISDGVAWYIT